MDQLIEQVYGILSRAGVDFQESDERDRFYVVSGSALVVIAFRETSKGDKWIRIGSCLLTDVNFEDPDVAIPAFFAINDANYENYAKFLCHVEQGTIVVEREILGNHLQADELLEALAEVYVLADGYDDAFKDAIGSGVRMEDVAKARHALDELEL